MRINVFPSLLVNDAAQYHKRRNLRNRTIPRLRNKNSVHTHSTHKKISKTRLFDISPLSKHQSGQNKTGGTIEISNLKDKQLDSVQVAPIQGSRYEGFSEKTLMLLTAKNASDFARKFQHLTKLQNNKEEKAHDGSAVIETRTTLTKETFVKNGPIWGKDAFYRQPRRYRKHRGNNSERNKSKRKFKKRSQQKSSLKEEFNTYMSLSTTRPQSFRQSLSNLKSGEGSTSFKTDKTMLAPVHAGAYLTELRKNISESMYSRSCGLSLREIETLTTEASKMTLGNSQSLPALSTQSPMLKDTVVIGVPFERNLEDQIFMELRERERSRESSRQSSRRRLSRHGKKPGFLGN